MKLNWLKMLTLTSGILCAFPALATTYTVNSYGNGYSREMARTEALKDAIMQVTGVTVDAENLQHLLASESSVNGKENVDIQAKQSQVFKEQIRGVVTGFRIINESKQSDGTFVMNLEVDIEKYDIPGVDSNRRSITVQGFEVLKSGACFGKNISQNTMIQAVTDAVQRALVSTRKFAILDRHGKAYDLEKGFIQGEDVKRSEQAKLGLNRGSDYIVSGKIRHISIGETKHKLQLSNRTQIDRYARADIGFDLMMFATREIQLSSNVSVSLKQNISGLSCEEIVARLAQKAAAEIAHKATLTIFPPSVINTAGRMIYFNYGGDDITVGQIYNLYSKGDPIYDPYTKEPLGNVEELIGQVKVVEVKPKYSVATWVDLEQIAPVKEGDILRPYQAPKQKASAPKKSKISNEW